jgi:hypothetical protein
MYAFLSVWSLFSAAELCRVQAFEVPPLAFSLDEEEEPEEDTSDYLAINRAIKIEQLNLSLLSHSNRYQICPNQINPPEVNC